MYVGLRVKEPLFLSDINEKKNTQQIFKKYSKIKIHEYPSSVSCIIPYRRTARRDEAKCRFLQNGERHLKSPHFLVAY